MIHFIMTELIRFTFRGRAIILQNNWKKATSPREYRETFLSLFLNEVMYITHCPYYVFIMTAKRQFINLSECEQSNFSAQCELCRNF